MTDSAAGNAHTPRRAWILRRYLMVRFTLASVGLAALLSGCNPNPYCLNCNPDDLSTTGSDAARPDVSNPTLPDLTQVADLADGGCTPTNNGVEKCDGIDND